MIKVLLLSAGTNACYHFAKTIKEKFYDSFLIIGADINEQYLIPSCSYIDKFYKVPYSTDKNYYNVILDICKKENINYVLPSFDCDQKLFYSGNKDLLNLNVISLGISKNSLEIYENKVIMNEFLRKNGFNIPKIYNLNDIDNNVQYFIKPINGVGSQGATMIYGNILKKRGDYNVLIQEKCSEPEITLECFNYNNILRTVARERIVAKSGVCIKTRIFNSEKLHDVASRFAKIIETPYCFNLQFMKNNKGENVITDVNLRLAGGMSLSAAAGWDEVSALANIMLKKDTKDVFATLPQKLPVQYVVRAYTDIVTKVVSKNVAFDLDGTLLDSRKRHKVVLDDILKSYNISIDTSDLIEFKRNKKNNIEYLTYKGLDYLTAKSIQEEWISNIENDKYLRLDILYPYTIDLINKHKGANLILITARNKKESVLKQLDSLNLSKFFKDIFVVPTSGNVAVKKAEILIKQNIDLIYGDTEVDYKAAKIANIEFIFCKNGFRSNRYII